MQFDPCFFPPPSGAVSQGWDLALNAGRKGLCVVKDGCWGYEARGGAEPAAGPLQCPSLSSRHRRSVGKTLPWDRLISLQQQSHRVQINSHLLSHSNTSSLCSPALPRRCFLQYHIFIIIKLKGRFRECDTCLQNCVLTEMRAAD